MTVRARRTSFIHGNHQGHTSLEQRFEFTGATAESIVSVLLTAPLTGEASIFGTRPGKETTGTEASRRLRGFSPVAGFRFDVDLTSRSNGFVVQFSQPDCKVPYLQGDALWLVSDEPEGAVLHEMINTPRAMETVAEPLGGPRPSLRRWLFFRMGHRQVMDGATRNIASLVDARTS